LEGEGRRAVGRGVRVVYTLDLGVAMYGKNTLSENVKFGDQTSLAIGGNNIKAQPTSRGISIQVWPASACQTNTH